MTLDRTIEEPDHLAGFKPDQFTSMVQTILAIEEALVDGIKRATKSALNNLIPSRESLVAKQATFLGEIFSRVNLTVKRPSFGISPMKWDGYIGRQSKRFYHADELIDE